VSPPIQGVFAALITPFDESRAIDTAALSRQIDYLAGRDLAGLAVLTEAAEDAVLTAEERERIVKGVAKRLKGAKPFVVQISAASSLEASDLARLVEARGGSGVILAPPRIPGLGYRELYRHVDRVARSITLPVLLLARPGSALESLQPEELATLFKHEGIRGVLAPHASVGGIQAWVKRFKKRKGAVLTGCALACSDAVGAGATGAVCGLAALAPQAATEIWEAATDGEKLAAARLEADLAPLVEALGPAARLEAAEGVERLAAKIARRSLRGPALALSYPFPAIKVALGLLGHDLRPDVRPPFEPLRAKADLDRLRSVLRRSGVLT
jgi:4-hydroxy-tetrahydrodipicolinate synthase